MCSEPCITQDKKFFNIAEQCESFKRGNWLDRIRFRLLDGSIVVRSEHGFPSFLG